MKTSWTISVFTATRAEYHLLTPVIRGIWNDDSLQLDLIVSGTHLCEKYGRTIEDIYADGFPVADTIETIQDGNSVDDIIALTLIGCSKHFKKVHPNFLVVLGDRYEILGAVIAAANARIPIAHIHGGETTIGAIDEAVRHAVTKFSYLHFTSCESYRKRVIQLGEDPQRVYNVGSLGVENILSQSLMSRSELQDDLQFDLNNYAVVTFHPVTLEEHTSEKQTQELIGALLEYKNLNYVVTKANADTDGEIINDIFEKIEKKTSRIKLVASLGMVRYLSSLKYCSMVIGNSSSGILEAPVFGVPTVNIGNRQTGRIKPKSVIDCMPTKESILQAMNKAMDEKFLEEINNMPRLYGDGSTSKIIIEKIKETLQSGVNLMKEFYDLVWR